MNYFRISNANSSRIQSKISTNNHLKISEYLQQIFRIFIQEFPKVVHLKIFFWCCFNNSTRHYSVILQPICEYTISFISKKKKLTLYCWKLHQEIFSWNQLDFLSGVFSNLSVKFSENTFLISICHVKSSIKHL